MTEKYYEILTWAFLSFGARMVEFEATPTISVTLRIQFTEPL